MNWFRRESPSADRTGVAVSELEWPRHRDAVIEVENAAFPYSIRSSEIDLETQARKGFGLVVREGICNNPVGYTIAMPIEKALYHGCTEDSQVGKGTTAYVESLAVKPGKTPVVLTKLVRGLFDQLEGKGYQRVTMHVEVDSKLYNAIISLGGNELKRFDNWQGWGKTFAYLEFPLR